MADDGRGVRTGTTTPNQKTADLTLNVLVNHAPSINSVTATPFPVTPGGPYKYQVVNFAANVTDADGDLPTVTWNFGDGSATKTGLTTSHTFMTAGPVTVTVTADDGKGNGGLGYNGTTIPTFTLPLSIASDSPLAAVVQPVSGSVYQNVGVLLQSTVLTPANGVAVASYQWYINGTSVPGATSATYNYSAPTLGSVSAAVQVVDVNGGVGPLSPAMTFTVIADVPPNPPTLPVSVYNATVLPVNPANLVNAPGPLFQNKDYEFVFSAGTMSVEGVAIKSYNVDYGDGKGPFSVLAANITTPVTYRYDPTVAGPVTIRVQAVDMNNLAGAYGPVGTFNLSAVKPVVTWVSPVAARTYHVTLGSSVKVSYAFTTTNPNGGTLTLALDPGDGSMLPVTPTLQTDGSYLAQVSYPAASAPDAGRTVTPKVTVTDGQLVNSVATAPPAATTVQTVAATQADTPPELTTIPYGAQTVSVAPDPTYALQAPGTNATWAGVPFTFSGVTVADADTDPLAVTWDFGDGNTTASYNVMPGTLPSVTHTYATAGYYTVKLTVDDGRLSGAKSLDASPGVTVLAHDTVTSLAISTTAQPAWVNQSFTATVQGANGTPTMPVFISWDLGDLMPAVTSPNAAADSATVLNLYSGLTLPWSTYGLSSLAPGAEVVLRSLGTTSNWAYPPRGLTQVVAKAYDGMGGVATSNTLTFTVASPSGPVTTLLTPAANITQFSSQSFTASATSPAGLGIASYVWNFGDGTVLVTATNVATHAYTKTSATNGGPYAVTVYAVDLSGTAGSASAPVNFTVLIDNPPTNPTVTVRGHQGNLNVVAAPGPLYQYKQYDFTGSATIGSASISSYLYNYGDGTIDALGTHTYSVSSPATVNVTVAAIDSNGLQSAWGTAVNFTVTNSRPTVTFTTPTTAQTLTVNLNKTVTQTVSFTVTNPQSAVGATNPIPVGNLYFMPNDPAGLATVGTMAYAAGTYSVVVTYPATAVSGSRVSTPTVYAVDAYGVLGPVTTCSSITVTTQLVNSAPTITVTAPTAASTSALTSTVQTVVFTLTDANNDPLNYTVDWGDGSTATAGSASGNTLAGVSVSVTHAYPDTFSGAATATINCTSTRAGAPNATPRSVNYTVAFNTYPTATITSPQASGTNLSGVAPSGAPAVVLPLNGKVTFSGTGTAPASASSVAGDGTVTFTWSFPGGVTSSPLTQTVNLASGGTLTPIEVTYAGVDNTQATPYLATLTVTDSYNRVSSSAPSGVNTQLFQRWIVVDGTHSQTFTPSFLYRQLSATGGTDTYTYAQTAAHGNNATVQIFQDGLTNSYVVGSSKGATTLIPVRDDVPFWLTIPGTVTGDTSDNTEYQFSIPNTTLVDPALETFTAPYTLAPSDGTAFAFQSAAAAGNPQLQIVTGSGFGPETVSVGQRRFQGSMAIFNNRWTALGVLTYAPNLRWVDRLSVPNNDPLGAIEFVQSKNLVQSFSGLPGYQLIPEWFVFLKTDEVQDWNSLATTNIGGWVTANAPTDLGFVVDPSYTGDSVSSNHLSVTALEALRAPAATTDPYDFDVMNAAIAQPGSTIMDDGITPVNRGALALNPTALADTTNLSGLVNTDPSTVALKGGLNHVSVPYDANSNDRAPTGTTYSYSAYYTRSTFSFAEYLWTKVWARPLVLNRTTLNWADTENFSSYQKNVTDTTLEDGLPAAPSKIDLPYFFYSNPTNPVLSAYPTKFWPFANNVSPDGSSYDLNVTNGGTFDASSPVSNSGLPGTNGVGRFFWTAFTPHYNADQGALISRTWQADGTAGANLGQVPVASQQTGALSTDATTAWGFLPPQDTVVDKRQRDATGAPTDGATGGYRVTWYNPTQASDGTPVAPDFWAVQLVDTTGATQLFLLASNYPPADSAHPTTPTQLLNASLVTDARTYLPSGVSAYDSTKNDKAGPGYCWFDVPLELRPPAGHSATVTVFALKSILRSTDQVTAKRVLNRSEWVQAVKTVTASYSIKPDGIDVGFAHKIPFAFPWDIVVVNGPRTPVAP